MGKDMRTKEEGLNGLILLSGEKDEDGKSLAIRKAKNL